MKAESLLDNFKGAWRLGTSGGAVSKSVTGGGEGIMDAVARAGITMDAVMKGVGGLDVDRLL